MYYFLPASINIFVSSKIVAMRKLKRYAMFMGLAAVTLFGSYLPCSAQPDAQNDLFSVLTGSCSQYMDVLANDQLDSANITLSIVTQPANGTLTLNGNYFNYCITSGFTGTDQFTYSISDGILSDTATAFINVLPSNQLIFPGDADQNGMVQHYDVLALGLAYNLTGPSRFSPVTANALAWQPSAFLSTNPGAADCNGDGIVNGADMEDINLRYGNLVPFSTYYDVDTSRCFNGYPFFIEYPNGDSVMDGDTLEVVIKLGNDFTFQEAYGAAFTLQFDNSFVDGNGAQFFTNNSWLIQGDTSIFFNRNNQAQGTLDIALTKTNHAPANGGGELLRARIPIDDNIDGIVSAPGWHDLNFQLNAPRIISEFNVVKEVCLQAPLAVHVYKMPDNIEENGELAMRIFPNPTNGLVQIQSENIEQLTLTDLSGRLLYNGSFNRVSQCTINCKTMGLAAGTYLLQVKTTGATITKKLIVQP